MSTAFFSALDPLQQAAAEFEWEPHADLSLRLQRRISVLRMQTLMSRQQLDDELQRRDLALPTAVGKVGGQDPASLCLAPREWLWLSEYLDSPQMQHQLRPYSDLPLTRITDQSNAWAALRLAGAAADWLLAKLVSTPAGTGNPPYCLRTRLENSTVLLYRHRLPAESNLLTDLFCDRSVLPGLLQRLRQATPHAVQLFQRFGNPS